MSKKLTVLLIGAAAIIIVGAISFFTLRQNPDGTMPSLVNESTLNGLQKISNDSVSTKHLAENLAPPTNTWFAGIALQEEPKTIFPTPLAFTPSSAGFSYSLTGIETNEKSIIASQRDDVTITITESTQYQVTRYDELSVTLTYFDQQGDALVTLTLVAGSPYLYLQKVNPKASLQSTQLFEAAENDIVRYTNNRASYGIRGATANGNNISLSDRTTFYAAFDQNDLTTLHEYALNQVESTTVSYQKGSDDFTTNLEFTTANNEETIIGLLPHQKNTNHETLFSIASIYGNQDFKRGSSISFSTPAVPVTPTLNIDSLSDAQLTELKTLLRREINATTFGGVDTYFAGKELYRAAQLLQLASQVDDARSLATIKQRLRAELQAWFSSDATRQQKVFTYDTKLQTIVGLQASFGSEEANDHHFHYGYFIYAASVLAQHEPGFAEEYGVLVDLLVADIANYHDKEPLPLRRSFDAYFGHSWASGTSPFNDGNNQESSSEAINAWIATSLWAEVRNNKTLQNQSGWMLSQEVNATQAYWLSPATNIGDGNYQHAFTPLNWGGKRDYSTFFSDEAGAKLGILLIPMSPTMQNQIVLRREVIDAQLNATRGLQSNVYNFEDYLLMYEALINPTEALSQYESLQDEDIDSANSRSYLYAWILANQQ